MLSKHKKLIIGCISFLFVITVGLVLFFSLSNKKTKIYVNSYDDKVKFSIGSCSVESFNVSSRTGNSITKTRYVDQFFVEKIDDCDYHIATYYTEYAGSTYTHDVLLYEGYFFTAWIDNSNQIILENMACEFSAATTEFLFAFPATDLAFDENQDNFIEWEDLSWINNFNSLVNFYSKIANGYCEIDEDMQTIKLNCCDANNFRKTTTEFPITITCFDAGLKLTFDSKVLAYD